jgi:hypothetical protein
MRQSFIIALLRTAIRLLTDESPAEPETESGLVTEFMRTRTRKSPGNSILLRDVYSQFLAWLRDKSSDDWGRTKFGRAIRASGFTVRNKTGNKLYVCDVEFK